MEPKTGKVVPPACLSIVSSMGAMFNLHFLANVLLIRVFEASMCQAES